MRPENIAYAAKINAACWLILKASKIAKRLADTTSEQQQAIENEIVEIGHRLYREATQEAEPETTHDSGEDYVFEAYFSAAMELSPDAERWFIQNVYWHGFTVEKAAEKWREFGVYLERAEEG